MNMKKLLLILTIVITGVFINAHLHQSYKSAGINGGDAYLYKTSSPEGAVYPLYLLEKAGNYGFYQNPYFNNMDNLSFIFPEGWSELSIHN